MAILLKPLRLVRLARLARLVKWREGRDRAGGSPCILLVNGQEWTEELQSFPAARSGASQAGWDYKVLSSSSNSRAVTFHDGIKLKARLGRANIAQRTRITLALISYSKMAQDLFIHIVLTLKQY